MLVVHSILLVGFGLNVLGDPDMNHLLTITVLSVLQCSSWVTGIVYKTTALSILEASFILNLLILSSWTIYNRHASDGNISDGQAALVCTITGIAFSTFICIMFYHTYLYLKSTKLFLKATKSRGETKQACFKWRFKWQANSFSLHKYCRAVGAGPAGPAAAVPIFGLLTRAKMPYELWWVVQLLL